MKKALITGITGQDGAYLAELLIGKDYEVHGVRRYCSTDNTARIDRLMTNVDNGNGRLVLHYGDVTDSQRMRRLVDEIEPDEIYNLAAQSQVQVLSSLNRYCLRSTFRLGHVLP